MSRASGWAILTHVGGPEGTAQAARTWHEDAACAKTDPDLHHPDGWGKKHTAQIRDAKLVCARCPVLDTCRQWAFTADEKDGIWGGLTAPERDEAKAAQARRATARAARVEAENKAALDVIAEATRLLERLAPEDPATIAARQFTVTVAADLTRRRRTAA